MATVDENFVKRIQPHSEEAERSVLGSMIMDRDAIVEAEDILRKEDFYQRQYGILFEAMVELYREGKPVDLVTLQNKLKEKELPEELSSLDFFRDLVEMVPTSTNIKDYARIVHEKATLRELIRVTGDIGNECYLGKKDTPEILEQTEKDIFQLLQNRRRMSDMIPIRQIVMDTLNSIEEASKMKGRVTGIATGFTELDYKLTGLHPAELILVAARPAMGKTAFALSLALNAAVKGGGTVMIFSLEMAKEQLSQRLLSMESKVEMQKLKTGRLERRDWDDLNVALDDLSRADIVIDDTAGISIMEMKSKCRRLKAERKLDLIVIDYLQLMNPEGRSLDSRTQEISVISRNLKLLARELDCPVLVLSQLSRNPEQRTDHRPMLSDLRDSGSIEQDADIVIFLYRDEYYHDDTDAPGECEVIIAKQRSGPTGTVRVAWLDKITKFVDIAGGGFGAI